MLLKEVVPFIYQAVLHDEDEKIYGSPDLLIRNDFMNILCNNFTDQNSNFAAQYAIFNNSIEQQNYYYYVIDIKGSTLYLRANGNTLLNQGRLIGYKGQIYIYHKILSKIQNKLFNQKRHFNQNYKKSKFQDPQIAFILGRKYKYTSCGIPYTGLGWFDKLGYIDYGGIDKNIIEKTNKAIMWRRNVQMNHDKMKLYPTPSNNNLYPKYV